MSSESQQQSFQDTQSKGRKIKFSRELPSLHIQTSVPSFDYPKPVSILKRKHYSFREDSKDENVSAELFIKKRISKSETDSPNRILNTNMKFKIDNPPKMQAEETRRIVPEIKIEDVLQNTVPSRLQSRELGGPRKIPTWVLLVSGIVVLIFMGWFISRMFFTKIKMERSIEKEITKKYLQGLTNYQIQNLQIFRPIILRQGIWSSKFRTSLEPNSDEKKTSASDNFVDSPQALSKNLLPTYPQKTKHLHRTD